MRINNNMQAVITNNQLLGTEDSLSKVMEKLSSGFSINHASDNPSGIAIAGKMQSQINGLGQASTNGDDGISVLQTAEGALNEVTEMIQRMRELAVQAANGTNSVAERETIQEEIDSLLEEIDRVATTTEFNNITLLDGTLDCRSYGDHVSRLQTSEKVPAGHYMLHVTMAATRATALASKDFDSLFTGESTDSDAEVTAGYMTINGVSVTLSSDMTADQAREAIRMGCEEAGAEFETGTDTFAILSKKYGTNASLELNFSSEEFAEYLGFASDEIATVVNGYKDSATAREAAVAAAPYVQIEANWGSEEDIGPDNAPDNNIDGMQWIKDVRNYSEYTAISLTAVGTDPKVTLLKKTDDNQDENYNYSFGTQATASFDGNHVTITDVGGFEMNFKLEAGYEEGDDVDGMISINVTDIGSMKLQVGVNEGQTMTVRIASISTEFMYIDDLDVIHENGSEDAMNALESALNYITSIRAKLGAYENRLEHTVNSLDQTEENMTSAISRIEDADMATTMVEYTKFTVLEQAGTSALAQANELPDLALQLLQ
ncbi:MAG: flagellin [Pseudobutyrivibrio sp.]|nr:flagellin [Pseudobutyrivibrio sp.]